MKKEIENEIIEKVKKLLYKNGDVAVLLNFNDIISILYDNNVLINDDDTLSYRRNFIHSLEKDNGEWHSTLAIPCTSNIQKHLFIEFKLLTSRKLEILLKDITDTCVDIITNIDIKITNIYID